MYIFHSPHTQIHIKTWVFIKRERRFSLLTDRIQEFVACEEKILMHFGMLKRKRERKRAKRLS
jgi:hypothetical protein